MSTEKEEFDLFDIDENRLDEEWLRQPRLFYESALKLASARKRYEQVKAERDVTVAELDKSIRSSPNDYGIEKITEPVVERTILLQTQHKDAVKAVIKAKHSVDLHQAETEALNHRKTALENLVSLRLANYFSEPKVKGGSGEQMKKVKRDSAFKSKKH